MYSPKISEELIGRLYVIAKQKRIPMTTLVNEIISNAICESEEGAKEKSINSHQYSKCPISLNQSYGSGEKDSKM